MSKPVQQPPNVVAALREHLAAQERELAQVQADIAALARHDRPSGGVDRNNNVKQADAEPLQTMTGQAPLGQPPQTADMFADAAPGFKSREELAPGACILRGFAIEHEAELLAALERVVAQAPFRHLVTPGGFTMSVAMTNCGALGWVSDRSGYRYAAQDPLTRQPWPPMPAALLDLAVAAAAEAGYPEFSPDACLINRYVPGARLTLHQDRNEHDLAQPIVSVSLGVPATFLFGGMTRTDPQVRAGLTHGDVVVWGGPSRLCFHGILPLKEAQHPRTGNCRINLTFRNVR